MSVHLDFGFKDEVNSFMNDIRESKMGSFDVAMRTVLVMRKLVGSTKWSNAKELIELIRKVGKYLTLTLEFECLVQNIIRRILKIVREEYAETIGNEDNSGAESLQNILMINKKEEDDLTQTTHGLKSVVIDAINELISELETCRENIAGQALEYIHSNEIIMTLGYSRTVEKFLKNAARKRKFTVVVAESAPFFGGQKLAVSLAESKLSTTVIADSAVFAIMSRVNKVIVGSHLVMADGGVMAANGTEAIALAAKYHSVPFIVCTGLFKLSPAYLCGQNQENFTGFLSPENIAMFPEGKTASKVRVFNPLGDSINAGLVDLFISDVGGNVPSYLYRLLTELYHPQDYDL